MMDPFSMLVLGDTQYLFDGARQNSELLSATFDEVARLLDSGAIAPLVHIIHVGDVTEHGWPEECSAALDVLSAGTHRVGGVGMTIATGNHDVEHQSLDDRGSTPFLETFGPGCQLLTGAHLSHAVEYGPGGYSSWRVVQLQGGERIGILAVDWRPSDGGWQWAKHMLESHSQIPTVLVSHDVAADAALTRHGRKVADLLEPHSHVFLVLGGHAWPSTRVRTAQREYHVVNYQELPFGGAGSARVYNVDPRAGRCEVISLCPALTHPHVLRSTAARRRLSLARPEDQFSFALPTALGGRTNVPWQADGMALVRDISPEGIAEFEAPLGDLFALEVQCRLPERISRDWQVLLVRLRGVSNESREPLAAVTLSTENFLGWMAVVEGGETWATSHEYEPGSSITVVVRNGDAAGVWVNGDLVGRADAKLAQPLLAGPWRWRVGAGEFDGLHADEFEGRVERVRLWSAPNV